MKKTAQPTPLELRREYNLRYREKNAEKIKEKRRAWYLANKSKYLAKCKARYEANKPDILERQRQYVRRKTEELGISPGTIQSRRYRARNIEKCRERSRNATAKSYREDRLKAAIKRAKTILSSQSGLPTRHLDKEIVEAKALQLLVRAEVYFPGRAVGQRLTDEETRQRRADYWQRWYQANKERHLEHCRSRRATKEPK